LKNRTLDRELRGGTSYHIVALKAIVDFEEQFKEWEKIAKNDQPPPPFIMLADGKRIENEEEGRNAAIERLRNEQGHAGAAVDMVAIPAFKWNGSKAALVVYTSYYVDLPEQDPEFFGQAREMLVIADDLMRETRASVQRAQIEKEASGKSVEERFKVLGADSASSTQMPVNSVAVVQSAASQPLSTSTAPLAYPVKYRAKLSANDLRNSKGAFLPDIPNIQARDILLQDRFNYHQKGIRDPEDTNEGLYEEGKDTLRKLFEGKEARLADGGDLMALLASEPVVDVALTENEIIVAPVE